MLAKIFLPFLVRGILAALTLAVTSLAEALTLWAVFRHTILFAFAFFVLKHLLLAGVFFAFNAHNGQLYQVVVKWP